MTVQILPALCYLEEQTKHKIKTKEGIHKTLQRWATKEVGKAEWNESETKAKLPKWFLNFQFSRSIDQPMIFPKVQLCGCSAQNPPLASHQEPQFLPRLIALVRPTSHSVSKLSSYQLPLASLHSGYMVSLLSPTCQLLSTGRLFHTTKQLASSLPSGLCLMALSLRWLPRPHYRTNSLRERTFLGSSKSTTV